MAVNGGQVTAKPPRRVGISDVARACGVSKATVSLALNQDVENSRLRDSTRELVLRVAKELGYRPNWRARALASNRTRSLGLVYAQASPSMSGAYESMGAVIAQTLMDHGYHLVFMPLVGSPANWRHLLLDHRVDGCLVMPPMPEGLGSVLAEISHPAVLINCDEGCDSAPRLLPDDVWATDVLVDHLLSLGHRRILFHEGLPRLLHFSGDVRRHRFFERMRQAGLEAGATVSSGGSEELVEQFWGPGSKAVERPTAIICVKADRAIQLNYWLWKRGLKVPGDVSLATFDDPWVLARTTPAITTVATPMTEIGQRAAEMLVQAVEQSTPLQPVRQLVQGKLVVRESTAAPRT